MKLQHTTDVSISLTIFYLKVIGCWFAVNRTQKYFRNIMVVYTTLSIVSYLGMQFRGLYVVWKDITVSVMIVFNVLGVSIGLFKLCLVLIRKEQFLELIAIMQENFWHTNYDFSERRIVADVRQMCISLVCTFSFFSQLTMFCYSMRPAVLNIGRNASERMLVFPLWLDPPYCDTPYFEIIYVIQVLNLYQGAFCYQCFDNIFCIMCMHVAGQFRMLQHRLINMQGNCGKLHEDVSHLSDEYLDKLKSCIRQHQALIEFCKVVNEVFTTIMLLQVLMFSLLVCLAGYQLFVLDLNVATRVSVMSLIATNMVQLWMFTYSCNIMTQESVNVSQAAYATPWIHLPLDVFGKMMRKDLQFLIMRSRRPCCVTACGFFPVSLETYTKIISTSMSYFTLLRQSTVDPVET